MTKLHLAWDSDAEEQVTSQDQLAPGGAGPQDPGMEARVAKLESDVGHIKSDISEIKGVLTRLAPIIDRIDAAQQLTLPSLATKRQQRQERG